MGRFYKPSKMTQTDYGFKYPAAAFERAVNKIDTTVDATIAQNEQLRQALEMEKNRAKGSFGSGGYLTEDAERHSQIIQGYESGIDKISQAISEDPLSAVKQTAPISKLRSEISTNILTGELSVFNRNLNYAEEWIKKNKNVSPEIVSAALEDARVEWKSSIDEDGNFRMIEKHLPDVLYDEDIPKKALAYATRVQGTLPYGERFEMVKDFISTDDNLIKTLYQNLDLGLLKDANGNYIDADGWNDETKDQAVTDEINRRTEVATRGTQDRYKPSTGSTTIPKEEKMYKGGGTVPMREGTGIIVADPVAKAIANYSAEPNEDNHKGVSHKQAVEKALNVELAKTKDTEDSIDKFKAQTQAFLLQYRLDDANTFADDAIKDRTLFDQSFLRERDEMIYTAYKVKSTRGVSKEEIAKLSDTELAKAVSSIELNVEQTEYLRNSYINWKLEQDGKKPTMLRIDATWGVDDFGIESRKRIETDVENGLNDASVVMRLNMQSTNPELNALGNFKRMVDNKLIRKAVKDNMLEDIDNAYTILKNKYSLSDAVVAEIREKQTVQNPNGTWTVNFSVTNDAGVKTDYSEKLQAVKDGGNLIVQYQKGKYENFKFSESSVVPTRTVDENGVAFFRVGAVYNGEDIDMLIPVSEFYKMDEDNDYTRWAMPRNDIGTEYYTTNYATSLYEMLIKEDVEKGTTFNYGDNATITYLENGRISLSLDGKSTGDDREQVIEYMKVLMTLPISQSTEK